MRLATATAALLAILTIATAPSRLLAADPPEPYLLALLNAERSAAGLHPLRAEPALQALARSWASEQATRQQLHHRSLQDQASWVESRITRQWERLAENVAYGASETAVHDALMQSTLHRANALGDFSHVGVGAARDTEGRLWVTYNFVKVRQSSAQLAPGGSTPARAAAAGHAIATSAQ